MSAITTPFREASAAWKLPYRGKVGMACLIVAESAIFTIFVVAYLYYVGRASQDRLHAKYLRRPSFTPSAYCPAV
jgi:cytochrome c oxidase subunit 3